MRILAFRAAIMSIGSPAGSLLSPPYSGAEVDVLFRPFMPVYYFVTVRFRLDIGFGFSISGSRAAQ